LDREFRELKTARSWNLTPAEWRAQSLDDRAMMMAYVMFTETVEQYRFHWKEQQRKKAEKPAGTNPYQAMKRDMGLK
jgi:hypothetical protein